MYVKDTDLKLKSYSGEQIHINGVINCDVSLDGQTKQLNLYVVQNGEKTYLVENGCTN